MMACREGQRRYEEQCDHRSNNSERTAKVGNRGPLFAYPFIGR